MLRIYWSQGGSPHKGIVMYFHVMTSSHQEITMLMRLILSGWSIPTDFINYCKISNIRHTPVGNRIVDHSDVIGASPSRFDSIFFYCRHGSVWVVNSWIPEALRMMYSQYSQVVPFADLEDPGETWDLVEKVGEGTYGEVQMAKHKVTGKDCLQFLLCSIVWGNIKIHIFCC